MASNFSTLVGDVVEKAARGAAEELADEVDATERAREDRNTLAVTFAIERHRMGCDAGYYDDGSDDSGEDWPIVWAVLPTGQVSWQVPPAWRPIVESELPNRVPVGGDDGHDRELKNERLLAHASGEEDRITRPVLPSP